MDTTNIFQNLFVNHFPINRVRISDPLSAGFLCNNILKENCKIVTLLVCIVLAQVSLLVRIQME